jgi:acetyl-CoA synthetase
MTASFVWQPTPKLLSESNVARFMVRHGITAFDELVARSISEPEWFWNAVVEDLGLVFQSPYTQVLDTTQGFPWARWFMGGRLNMVESLLDRHLREGNAERLALIWENEQGSTRQWTYRELFDETCRAAAGLKNLGVQAGDRVALFLPMIPEAVAAFLAVARLGAICVPIFSGFGVDAVAARLNDSAAVVLITADGVVRKGNRVNMKEVAEAAAARSPSLNHVLICGDKSDEETKSACHTFWHQLPSAPAEGVPCEVLDAEAPVMIAYTSGTTGKPKGAVHVHGGFLVKIAQEVAHQVDMTANDRLFWFTDLGWIMGPWELVGALAAGGTVVLYDGAPETPTPDRVWQIVARHQVTILGVSPTLIRALMRHGEDCVRQHNLTSLRILASTGEPWNLDPWLWYFRVVGRKHCPIINISGGTEVGACFLSAFPVAPQKPCSLGGPALGMAVDVVDAEGNALREGVGELICRKPWPAMTRGLWKDPERYLEAYWSRFSGVWTHGDWASIDADGQWFLHGRSDDTLNVAGKRIGPAEIESVLVGEPEVAEAAAVGVPHPLKGEVIWCFVVLRQQHNPPDTLINRLRASVEHALGKSFAPERLVFVPELPRTRNAKILRRAIRAVALGQPPGDLSGLENPQALEEIRRASQP